MTVNLVPQFAIQKTTTFADLRRMFDPKNQPQRAGLTLTYHQRIDDRSFLTGDLGFFMASGDAFGRAGVVRTGGWHHSYADDWRVFSGKAETLALPPIAEALVQPLIAQRKGLETLVPRLYELHEARSARLKSRPDYSGYQSNSCQAILDLPVVDYLEALDLLGNATFSLVHTDLLRMSRGFGVKRIHDVTPATEAAAGPASARG